ncbi:MAG TPA: hypothetical protein VGM30_16080 [Puia sp.]|jgi:hypothetical protein
MYAVIEENGNKALELQSIHARLEEIRLYLEKEISFKQRIIDEQGNQILQLKDIAEAKDLAAQRLESQLQECRQTNEGTRQLINKLLNDISNYQKDIEWYKRTYEKRSLLGTIRQKLFRK